MHQQLTSIQLNGNTVNYTVKRSKKRRRTLSMMLHPQHGIIVQVPWHTSAEELQEFIYAQQRWLLASNKQFNEQPKYEFSVGEQLSYLGEICHLQIIESAIEHPGCKHFAGELHVTIRPQMDESTKRKAVYETLRTWYMDEAHPILLERLAFWQERLGLTYNQLKITDPKQQWGCCDTKNNLRINWRIMLTRWELVDYLLVHELCHVRHKDHSRRFWKLVGSVLPDYASLRRELRNHSAISLIPPANSPSPAEFLPGDHTMFGAQD